MPTSFPNHIVSALFGGDEPDASGINEAVARLAEGAAGIIFSADGRNQLLALVTNPPTGITEIVRRQDGRIPSWRYQELVLNGEVAAELVEIPSDLEQPPPTKAEVLIVKAAWQTDAMLNQGVLRPNVVCVRYRSALEKEKLSDLVNALAGEVILPDEVSPNALSMTSNSLTWSSESRLSKHLIYRNVFTRALREQRIQWRFLGFYRVLEYGYLDEVLNALQSSFFQDPASSVAMAKKSLEAELNQLVHLVTSAALQQQFESLADKFVECENASNRFAIALRRQLADDGLLTEASAKDRLGAMVVYKIRCAIVHAGKGALIYESFPDAHVLLKALLLGLERATLRFLGVTPSD